MKPLFLAVTFLVLDAGASSAQWARAAIAYVEGSVYVDGQAWTRMEVERALKDASVVRTEKGRAEVVFGRGDMVFLGENSSVRVNSDFTPLGGIEILTGSAVVIAGEVGPAVSCEETVHLSDAGIFRFDFHGSPDDKFCKVRVYKGAAAVQMPSFVWVLTPGKMIDLNRLCGDHTPRIEFKIEDLDGLDRWSRERAGK
jgi:hypothetical protein